MSRRWDWIWLSTMSVRITTDMPTQSVGTINRGLSVRLSIANEFATTKGHAADTKKPGV